MMVQDCASCIRQIEAGLTREVLLRIFSHLETTGSTHLGLKTSWGRYRGTLTMAAGFNARFNSSELHWHFFFAIHAHLVAVRANTREKPKVTRPKNARDQPLETSAIFVLSRSSEKSKCRWSRVCDVSAKPPELFVLYSVSPAIFSLSLQPRRKRKNHRSPLYSSRSI